MDRLHLVAVGKSFGATPVLSAIDLEIADAEILALLGPSGCGKTTLLRIIAGLERPDRGRVLVDGQDITDLPAHKRRFGLMFQDYALFPHMNVAANIGYGLGCVRSDAAKARISDLLRLVGLAGHADRDVNDLSGGEKQRVALARSLAPSPRLLMLDEPLAALDRALRDHLSLEIKTILKNVGVPAILVTHDQGEAFAMADRIAVMDQGRILQCAPPTELLARPASTRVAGFLGLTNVLRSGEIFERIVGTGQTGGAVLIRPDAARVGEKEGGPNLEVEVRAVVFRGYFFQVQVHGADADLSFMLPEPLPVGQKVTLSLDAAKILRVPD